MATDHSSTCCAPTRGPAVPARAAPAPASAAGRPRGLVDLPGATFSMGYDGPLANPGEGEGPVREAAVEAFSIGATTVTNRQFAAFVRSTGHRTMAEESGWSFVFHQLVTDPGSVRGRVAGAEWWCAVDGADWRRPGGAGSDARPHHPVVHVSARDAEAYCAWVGGRLPTEVEWEYAARGGLDRAVYPWGDEHPALSRAPRCTIWEGDFPVRHSRGLTAVGTAPVTSLRPNGFGLHHTVGNVWEWTAQPWTPPPDALGVGPEGEQRVRRGGSYLCHDSYCNRYRVAARDHSAPDDTTGNIGFRVAL